jgi:hypothetical protein
LLRPRYKVPGGTQPGREQGCQESKPRRELQALRKQSSKLYDEVYSGEVEPKVGAVLTQITNTQARILELERKLKETEELEERLEALEQAQPQKAGNRWLA